MRHIRHDDVLHLDTVLVVFSIIVLPISCECSRVYWVWHCTEALLIYLVFLILYIL